MNTEQQSLKTGAPLRVLALIFGCWMIGRLAWGHFSDVADTENVLASPSTQSYQTVNVVAGDEAAKVDRIGLKKQNPIAQFSEYAAPATQAAIRETHQLGVAKDSVLLAKSSVYKPVILSNRNHSTETATRKQPTRLVQLVKTAQHTALEGSDDLVSKKIPLSGYFWVFARQGDFQGSPGSRISRGLPGATYGGSQAGAILSYKLAGTNRHSLSIFGRLSVAKKPSKFATDQEEVAIGVKVKPLSSLPITIHAEQRLGMDRLQKLGTAIYLAGGVDAKRLEAGFDLDAYGQAGYVFDQRDSYFFDASASLQRELAQSGRKKLKLGAGLWAGGQRGVRRLDVGPKADFRLPVVNQSARVTLDWRKKIAGNAQADNGFAVTLSSGF